MDELFAPLMGDFRTHGFGGFEEGGSMEPCREDVRFSREGWGFFGESAEDVLADFLRDLAVLSAAQGGVKHEAEIAVRQSAEGGFIAMGREGFQERFVGIRHDVHPITPCQSPMRTSFFPETGNSGALRKLALPAN